MITIILSALAVVIFFTVSYFIGNALADSFGEPLGYRIVQSFLGLIVWVVLAVVIFISYMIYDFTYIFLTNLLK